MPKRFGIIVSLNRIYRTAKVPSRAIPWTVRPAMNPKPAFSSAYGLQGAVTLCPGQKPESARRKRLQVHLIPERLHVFREHGSGDFLSSHKRVGF